LLHARRLPLKLLHQNNPQQNSRQLKNLLQKNPLPQQTPVFRWSQPL
jgi:hypothetical protein